MTVNSHVTVHIRGSNDSTLSVSEEMNCKVVRGSALELLYGAGTSNCGYVNPAAAELAREQEK